MCICKKAIAAYLVKPLMLSATVGGWLFSASSAWAEGGPCSGGPQSVTLSLPATVTVPRDAKVGSVLTPWVFSSAANTWTCSVYSDNSLEFAYAGPTYTASSGVYVTNSGGGGNILVMNTNVPGIGIAMNARVWGANAQGWQYQGGGSTTQTGTKLAASGVGPANFTNYGAGAQVAVALVKTATPFTQGGVVNGGQVAYAYPATSYSAGYQYTNLATSYFINAVTIVPLTCSTPDVQVPLGSHRKSEFKGAGYTTNAVSFNFALNNCPAGLGGFGPAIQYKLDATTAVLNSSQSVVALDETSGATGVGVQLLDGDGSVFPLSTYKTFSGYSSATGGTYSIPFKARYYQTAATVTPGKANSSMTVTMLYQ